MKKQFCNEFYERVGEEGLQPTSTDLIMRDVIDEGASDERE